jgi:adenine-specific DNA-methyltransferase
MQQLILPSMPRDDSVLLIKYMGSKRNLLHFIVPVIESVASPGTPVVDLFAGTHSVGYALAGNHPIYANDIQAYSGVIGEAVLSRSNALPTAEELRNGLSSAVATNREGLRSVLEKWLDKESEHLQRAPLTESSMEDFARFQADFPYVSTLTAGPNAALRRVMKDLLNSAKANTGPWCLFSTYFNNSYFSLSQAIEIDSYRRAIDILGSDKHLRSTALACLMHACAYCTPGAGHFAQFRQPNSMASYEDILKYRNRSISEYFFSKYRDFREHLLPAQYDCYIHTRPYLDYLNSVEIKHVEGSPTTVYADPPYSFVHYSRFYHVLETLVRYDYPACEHFGRYRDDRYQSPFCQHAHAANEFKVLARAAFRKGMNLVISYTDSALVPSESVLQILVEIYGRTNVSVATSDYLHATMGRSGDRHREVNETAFLCRFVKATKGRAKTSVKISK